MAYNVPQRAKRSAEAFLRHHQNEERALMLRVERAVALGYMRKAMKLRDTYLRSYSARLVAVDEANRKLKPNKQVSSEEVRNIAQDLDLWECCDEPVVVDAIPKANGKLRSIMNFGLCNRARQQLVTKVFTPFLRGRLHPAQYDVKGRGGRRAACAAIKSALDGGMKWALRLDVADFYPSIDPRRVEHLIPLPRKVVETTLVGASLRLVNGNSTTVHAEGLSSRDIGRTVGLSFISRSRAGIPQGSPVSSLVGPVLIAPVLAELPDAATAMAYGDDVLVLTATKREAEAHLKTLQRAFDAHPAGSLQLKRAEVRRVADGFEFLGYKFRVKKGSVTAEPSNSKGVAFARTVNKFLGVARHAPAYRAPLRLWVLSRIAHYPLWEIGRLYARLTLEEIARWESTTQLATASIWPVARQPIVVTLPATRRANPQPVPPPYAGPRLVIPRPYPILSVSLPT